MTTSSKPEILVGYRVLEPTEIALANAVKTLAEEVGKAVDEVEGTPDVDKRWVAIARTQLQQGFMALVRSITRPTTF